MKTIKLVLLDVNEDTLADYADYFGHKENYEVCASANDGAEGIKAIEVHKPDFVILNLTLKGIDGFGVMEEIKRREIRTEFIVLGLFGDDSIINRVMSRGARYYLIKPVSAEIIDARIADILSETNKSAYAEGVREKKRATSIDEKISSIFISIGIPPHIKGYNYLREGIKMAVSEPSLINNVTKMLYPRIAERYDTTASKVERAIRHAIEVAWNRGRVDAINAIFGVRVYIGNEKPTNSEFIALVADKLILESYM